VPKSKTEKRPIGIPTYEDKIAQKAVQMVLEPIYEQQFHDFSYGFRPGKSQHMALDRWWQEVMQMRGAYVIDLDISKYSIRSITDCYGRWCRSGSETE